MDGEYNFNVIIIAFYNVVARLIDKQLCRTSKL